MHKKGASYDGKHFSNPVPTDVMEPGSFFRVMKKWFQSHPEINPRKMLGPFPFQKATHELQHNGLNVTWLGHSTVLMEIDGKRILTDPVWSKRASPFSHMGPKRYFDVPVSIEDLPPIDLILLSHDHYDHLDKKTILKLTGKGVRVITMLGVGKRLLKWGVPSGLVTEMNWWDKHMIDEDFHITATPTRHFSGRWINDRFTTLWGAFAIKGPHHHVYYGADSGYYEGFKEIGQLLGPFDLTMMEIGAYNEDWASVHMGPENAVQAHIDVKGKVLMPIHWGTFPLAFHPWKEPAEMVIAAAQVNNVPLLMPAPGETIAYQASDYRNNWWNT
jgi:L-ascorbate metabolism protein UlaG (beta-lactamase superfamily)